MMMESSAEARKIAPFKPLAKPIADTDGVPTDSLKWTATVAPEGTPFEIKVHKDPGCTLERKSLNEKMRECYQRPDEPNRDTPQMWDEIKDRLDEEFKKTRRAVAEYMMLRMMVDLKKEKEEKKMNLSMMMKLVDNNTPVRIEVRGEEYDLTPHRLAMYGGCEVKKMFINCKCELEMELEE